MRTFLLLLLPGVWRRACGFAAVGCVRTGVALPRLPSLSPSQRERDGGIFRVFFFRKLIYPVLSAQVVARTGPDRTPAHGIQSAFYSALRRGTHFVREMRWDRQNDVDLAARFWCLRYGPVRGPWQERRLSGFKILCR
jgi:hypothetical protein